MDFQQWLRETVGQRDDEWLQANMQRLKDAWRAAIERRAPPIRDRYEELN